jgi:hypothetical protein
VLIDYSNPKSRFWRQRHGVTVLSSFTLSEFGLSIEKPCPRPMAKFHNRWHFTSPDPNFFHRVPNSFPATDGKRVYFGSDAGVFWCLDGRDGSVVWSFKVNEPGHKNIWSSPALNAGKVYFGSYPSTGELNLYSRSCRPSVLERPSYSILVGHIGSNSGLISVSQPSYHL